MSNIKRHSLSDIVRSFAAYIPGGELFEAKNVPGTNLHDLLNGLSLEIQRAENFLAVYLEEFIPSGTIAFIEEWESAVGIPDDCFTETDSLNTDERRQQILVKLASLGVQTIDDFRGLAKLLGFDNLIIVPGIEAGISPVELARFSIVITIPEEDLQKFPLSFPIQFGNTKYAIITCLIEKLKPANCVLLFTTIYEGEGFTYEFPFNFIN